MLNYKIFTSKRKVIDIWRRIYGRPIYLEAVYIIKRGIIFFNRNLLMESVLGDLSVTG